VADPHTLDLDGPTQPWSSVRDREHCPACFGALPPDTEAACSDCGTGTPPGLTVLQPLAAPPPARTSWATWPNPLEPDNFTNMTDAGWGAADVGSAWTTVTSGSADFSTATPLATMRQATFTPTGPPHFPVPPLSDPPRAPLGDVEDWENGDVIATLKRLPWWRRIWRRRG
jgi:hypothetical protein